MIILISPQRSTFSACPPAWRLHALLLCLLLFWASASRAEVDPEKPIYYYLSAHTDSYLKASGTSNNLALATWRKYLRKACKCFAEVGRAELLAGPKPGLLILASVEVLDDEERQAIKAFADAGGSLLATWKTGSRNARGELVGYGLLDALFKVRVLGEFTRPNNEHWFMLPFGDGPLTWPLPAQRRMYMGDAAQNMLRLEADNLAAVVMNWDRERQPGQANGVMAFHEGEKYRAVYFGFPESAWEFSKSSELLPIINSVFAWLQREPRLVKSAWPDAHIAAHLMEMDTEDKFFSAPSFASDLESIGVKGTFYSLTSSALAHPGVVRDLLARGHEIAYHADIHVGFAKQSLAQQEDRIKAMVAQMTGILGEQTPRLATGFRAPTESYDATTEVLLRKHGMLHHAADPSATEDRLPFFSKSEPGVGPEQALVVLPRTQFDDVSYRKLGFSPAQVQATLQYDLDLAVQGGAFSLLSVHTQNYVEGALLTQVMPAYMRHVQTYQDRIWIPRGDQIAAWWRQRERVSVQQLERGKSLVLQMAVAAPGEVRGLTVLVMNPRKGLVPSVKPVPGKAARARVTVKPVDLFRSAVVFDTLEAGDFEYVIGY